MAKDPKNSTGRTNAKGKTYGKRNNNYRTERERADKESAATSGGKHPHNDPEWYCRNGQAIKDVASLSFNTALGADTYLRSPGTSSAFRLSVPGVMAIKTVPTIGVGSDMYSPANIAARDVYSDVRKANSGSKNYDPADLMIYLLAMDSIYGFWAWMVRLYGTLRLFSKVNRYVGDVYVMAQGGDPGDLRKNLANFRAYINNFAQQVMALSVPTTMTYTVRHMWMYSNMYKDEDTQKAGVYMYVPSGFYMYNPTISAGAGGLQVANLTCTFDATYPTRIAGTLYNSYSNIMAYGDALLQNVLGDEDIAIMSGDILKAYGPEGVWKLDYINEDYGVLPVFSEEVLAQIHNTEFAGRAFGVSDGSGGVSSAAYNVAFAVFQDPNVQSGKLFCEPHVAWGYHLTYDKILDFWKPNPSPEDVIVASRNTLYAEKDSGTTAESIRFVKLTATGSEVCLVPEVFKMSNGVVTETIYWVTDNDGPTADKIFDYCRFNEAPTRLIVDNNGVGFTYLGELDTYTSLSGENVDKMHTTALLSMFGVPYGK
nr:putative capsid protein [Picobirnavirus sp.]